jgi:transposase InsO family protein
MKQLKKEEIAANRMKIIAPIIHSACSKSEFTSKKKEICCEYGISDRTLRRYLEAYTKGGFDGLKSKEKTGYAYSIPEKIVEEAILLRREVPSRSVAQIINILEMEGKVEKSIIKRSTLQDRLTAHGYSTRQMKLYADTGLAARRFARKNRNGMWHSDIKFGPYLDIEGKKQQIYMVCFLDDCTRMVLHCEFYATLDQSIIEDCFRKAILKYGIPERVYFDNGKQYRNKWMLRACDILGIKLIYAKPYSPESTGKIERFNLTVNAFLDELSLQKPDSLAKVNASFNVWLSECYHNKEHSSLGKTPLLAYESDSTRLRFLDADTVARAFLHSEIRKVDKCGCISFEGKKYEAGILLAGQKVGVVYDPANQSELTIEADNYAPIIVKELKIGEHTGPRPKLPNFMDGQTVSSSRLLAAGEKIYSERMKKQTRAIEYPKMPGGKTDV